MLFEIFLLLVFLAGLSLHLARVVKTKYLLISFAGILLLIAGTGILSGLELVAGETITYNPMTDVPHYTAVDNITGYTTQLEYTTVNNVPTFVIALTMIGFALYLIIMTPFVRTGED